MNIDLFGLWSFAVAIGVIGFAWSMTKDLQSQHDRDVELARIEANVEIARCGMQPVYTNGACATSNVVGTVEY